MAREISSDRPFRLSLNLGEDQASMWPAIDKNIIERPAPVAKTRQLPKLTPMRTELVLLTKDRKDPTSLSPLLPPRSNALRNEVLSFTTERGDIRMPSPAVTRPQSLQANSMDGERYPSSPSGSTCIPSLAASNKSLPAPPTRLHKVAAKQRSQASEPIPTSSMWSTWAGKVKSLFSRGPSYNKLHERQSPAIPCAPETDSIRADLALQAEELLALSNAFKTLNDDLIAPESDVVLKAKAIMRTAQRPIDHVVDTTSHAMEAAVIRTLMHTKTLHFLPKYGGLSVAELSLLTHVEAGVLSRLLSAAVSFKFLAYNFTSKKYRHTRLSAAYSDPSSAAGSFFTSVYDIGVSPLVSLPSWLDRAHDPGGKDFVSNGAPAPTPFVLRYGTANGDTSKLLGQMSDKMAALQHGMAATARTSPYVGAYPFDRLAAPQKQGRKRFTLVDVGGGHGHAIAAILAAYPTIKASECLLQDLAEVITVTKAGKVLPDDVQLQAHDSFVTQPVLGARAYYMRAILHNQSDGNCIRILKEIARAMAADSVLLIAENVISEDPAARTSLASYMDLIMVSVGGKERTEDEFEALVEPVGLKVVRVWRAEKSSMYGIVECRLKR